MYKKYVSNANISLCLFPTHQTPTTGLVCSESNTQLIRRMKSTGGGGSYLWVFHLAFHHLRMFTNVVWNLLKVIFLLLKPKGNITEFNLFISGYVISPWDTSVRKKAWRLSRRKRALEKQHSQCQHCPCHFKKIFLWNTQCESLIIVDLFFKHCSSGLCLWTTVKPMRNLLPTHYSNCTCQSEFEDIERCCSITTLRRYPMCI